MKEIDNLTLRVAQYIGEHGLYQEKGKGDNWYDVDQLMFNSTEALIVYVREVYDQPSRYDTHADQNEI